MEYVVGAIISGIIGAIAGAVIGFFAAAVCVASGKASRAEEAQYSVIEK